MTKLNSQFFNVLNEKNHPNMLFQAKHALEMELGIAKMKKHFLNNLFPKSLRCTFFL